MKFVRTHLVKILFFIVAAYLAGCSFAPRYKRPAVETPATFKENSGTNNFDTNIWQVAQPNDAVIRTNWWELFDDTNLNSLEDELAISNQNIVASFEDFLAAHAMVGQARSQYFPTLTASPSVTRDQLYSGGFALASSSRIINTFELPLDASWQPDLWGRVRNTVRSSIAQAQASAADLENTKLTAQSELASDYFQLRGQDALEQLFAETVEAYSNSLHLTTVLYRTGIDSEEDVVQAETQLRSTEAQATNLRILRAQLEHAIAVLIGRAPAELSIPQMPLTANPPNIPVAVPSYLLQRRPDIASAERAVASANAQIGVARAAYFPNLTLTATGGFEAPNIDTLLDWSSRVWSLGASASQSIFDAGQRYYTVAQYKAAYNASVAQYRQTVLTAFQGVEDNLSNLRILKVQIQQQEVAVQAALKYVNLANYRYKLGIDSYLNVIVAQTSYLSNRQTLINLYTQQMTDAVQLVENLGGGWDNSRLPKD